MSWYLDIVSPGWEALVLGDYQSVMPIPIKKKKGLKYVVQPILTQQLGIFGQNVDQKTLGQFFHALKKTYCWTRLNINYENFVNSQNNNSAISNNYILPLDKEYAQIHKTYSTNTLRNVKKAIAYNHIIIEETNFESAFNFFVDNYPYKYPKESYILIKKLFSELLQRGYGKIISVKNNRNEKLCSIFFICFNNRHIATLNTQTPEGKEQKAMYFIFDRYIALNCNKNCILDFEGSNIAGIANFFKGFGAINQPYTFINQKSYWSIIKQLFKK